MLRAIPLCRRALPPGGARGLKNLRLAVAKETGAGERRVALVPKDVEALVKRGAAVSVEEGAGEGSGLGDDLYVAAGASVVSRKEAWGSDMVVKVRPPTDAETEAVGDRSLVGMIAGRQNTGTVDKLAKQGATLFDLTMLLRTLSRGQAFDVLSSQASIAGYRAVIEAAGQMQRTLYV